MENRSFFNGNFSGQYQILLEQEMMLKVLKEKIIEKDLSSMQIIKIINYFLENVKDTLEGIKFLMEKSENLGDEEMEKFLTEIINENT